MSYPYSRRIADLVRTERVVILEPPARAVVVEPGMMIAGLDFPEQIVQILACNEAVCET